MFLNGKFSGLACHHFDTVHLRVPGGLLRFDCFVQCQTQNPFAGTVTRRLAVRHRNGDLRFFERFHRQYDNNYYHKVGLEITQKICFLIFIFFYRLVPQNRAEFAMMLIFLSGSILMLAFSPLGLLAVKML